MTYAIETRHVSVPSLCTYLGVSYRTVDNWCRSGILGSRLKEPVGSGQQRTVTEDEVLRMVVICSMASVFRPGTRGGSWVYPRAIKETIPTLTVAKATSRIIFFSDDACTSIDIDLPRLKESAQRILGNAAS